MPNETNQNRLISHAIAPESLDIIVQKIKNRIVQAGDKPYVTVTRCLDILTAMQEFDVGRYLLQHQGLNGFWTHYLLTHPWFGRKTGKNNRGVAFNELEDFITNRSPVMLATQQRFAIFLRESQQAVKNHARLACIPGGMMGELLYLNYDQINDIKLIGIDYDSHGFQDANHLATQQKLISYMELIKLDAWQLPFQNEFDLISSNGLTIYEPDDERIMALYRLFYQALKKQGKLVTSFLTPSPPSPECPWDMSAVNPQDLLLQKILYQDIIGVKWQCYRTEQTTQAQLLAAGFKDIQFYYDAAKIFPTVVAYK